MEPDGCNFYDRQLRLWGSEAQQALGDSCVALSFGNGQGNLAVGQELLKNLTLLGVGTLRLYGAAIVTVEDAKTSFFLEDNDVGCSLVEMLAEKIGALNTRVRIEVPRALDGDSDIWIHLHAPQELGLQDRVGRLAAIAAWVDGDRAVLSVKRGGEAVPGSWAPQDTRPPGVLGVALAAIVGGLAAQETVALVIGRKQCENYMFIYEGATGAVTGDGLSKKP